MSTPSALIIGEDGNRVPHLVQYLQSLGCRCHFAGCFEEACRLIASERFDLVFSPVRRQPGTISSLMEALKREPACFVPTPSRTAAGGCR